MLDYINIELSFPKDYQHFQKGNQRRTVHYSFRSRTGTPPEKSGATASPPATPAVKRITP